MHEKHGKDCLIVGMFSKNESPYVYHYTAELEKHSATYDVVYFERYRSESVKSPNEIVFHRYCPTGGKKRKKLATMFSYARFIRNVLKNGKYKFVIVLTTIPAVILKDILERQYKKNFILDIRDYTYENNSAYRRIVWSLVRSSFRTVLSSRGFLTFLPEDGPYEFVHNIPRKYSYIKRTEYFKDDPIVIGFVGSIRYCLTNMELVERLSSDNRFKLAYWGTTTNDCDLEEFCEGNGYSAQFNGEYDNSDKPNIYTGIDMINSVYDINAAETHFAIPNRLYDAAIYGCPIVVSTKTYLAEVVSKYGLGVAVDISSDDLVFLFERYISSFRSSLFEEGRHRLLKDVEKDMDGFRDSLAVFIDTNKGGLS